MVDQKKGIGFAMLLLQTKTPACSEILIFLFKQYEIEFLIKTHTERSEREEGGEQLTIRRLNAPRIKSLPFLHMEPAALSPGLFAEAERKISPLVVDDLMNGQLVVLLYLSGAKSQPGGTLVLLSTTGMENADVSFTDFYILTSSISLSLPLSLCYPSACVHKY